MNDVHPFKDLAKDNLRMQVSDLRQGKGIATYMFIVQPAGDNRADELNNGLVYKLPKSLGPYKL